MLNLFCNIKNKTLFLCHLIYFCPNSWKPHRREHRMGYLSMANPKINRDTICRNQPTAVLWQQQISDSGPRSHKPELKFKIHLDKRAKRGSTKTSTKQAERGKRPDQWQRWPQGSMPNRSPPGDNGGPQPPRLDSPSSWWTFSWPASSEMCHHHVRVINRSGYMPERAVGPQHLHQIRSAPDTREHLLAQTELVFF